MTKNDNMPQICVVNDTSTLMVEGKPLLMIAGEVRNSTSSSIAWMDRAWDKAAELGLNTLLVPVTWELTEPEEGVYDFSMVDALIDQARERNGHLVPLWFGAWKNASCAYAPAWVKRDTGRFWRAEAVRGAHKLVLHDFYDMPNTTLSAFCDATREADARAFSQLMAHIRSYDEGHWTVLAAQVENECGLMGSARDHCDAAEAAYAQDVPEGLITFIREHAERLAPDIATALAEGAGVGSWSDVFGPCSEELFQTYHTAAYVEAVAAAGRAEYPLPLFCNAWLDKGNRPGLFPTGGPNARVMEIWRYAAPSVDVCSPDIYVRTFCEVCDSYRKLGNALLIPETATHAHVAPRLAWSIAHHHALCFSPFGFEEMGQPFSDDIGMLFGIDTSDPALRTPQDPATYAAVAKSMAGLFAAANGYGSLDAVIEEQGAHQTLDLGTWALDVTFGDTPGAVAALPVADDEAYVLVMGASIDPRSKDSKLPFVDLLACEDGEFVDGVWVRDRRLNGDEVMSLSASAPTLLRIQVLRYA